MTPNQRVSGYAPQQSDWYGFLRCWREQTAARHLGSFPAGSSESPRPGENIVQRNSATDTAAGVLTLERRLQVSLPRSFRDFQAAVGGMGWYVAEDGFDREDASIRSSLYGLQDIGRVADVDQSVLTSWNRTDIGRPPDEEYYRYGYNSAQVPWAFDGSRLPEMIKVGGLAQGGVVLLNPLEVTADGEMEAWVLTPWHGVVRYRSFAELMLETAYRDINGVGGFLVDPDLLSQSKCLQMLSVHRKRS